MVKSLGYSRRALQPGNLIILGKMTFIDLGQVCCHNNPHVGFFALDALRQLAMRFLEKEELPHFKFQKDFLKPFEYTMMHNPNPAVRDMVRCILCSFRLLPILISVSQVLTCFQQMIQARVHNMRSGWRTMFGVFSAASKVLTGLSALYLYDTFAESDPAHRRCR
jgi:Sec7-like guanine-nucleotide exchange factor